MSDSLHNKLLRNIEEFGCQVMHVAAEGDLPPFSYSVGIQQSTNAPEIVVVGLKQPLAHSVVNEYNKRVRSGERFIHSSRYSGFLDDFEIQISEVHKANYDEYFGQACKFYGGSSFDVIQIVWPNTSGVWPWDAEASDWFRSWQPLLAHSSA